ncbi:hypothetical protein GCM10010464_27090 [Pseudonocardia yunnanensis]
MLLVRGAQQGADGWSGGAWERAGAPGHPQASGVVAAAEDQRDWCGERAQYAADDGLCAGPGLDLSPGAPGR